MNLKINFLKKWKIKRSHMIILLLLLLLFFIFYYTSSSIEKYTSEDGDKDKNKQICKGTPFCAYDTQKQKCGCAYQKDDARLQFPNDPNCCETQCNALPKEKCVANNDLQVKYYCNRGGVCQEYNATIRDSVIMANICGIDNVTNQYIMPFASKEECQRSSDVCAKYNDDKLSKSEQMKGCLGDTNCGMCYNESGEGKCVSGSPMGPNDLSTYYFCKPSERKSDGSNRGIYKYGMEFTGL